MVTLVLEAVGPLDTETVWERYARPELWPTWAPHLSSVEASTDRIATGTTGVVRGLGVVRARFRVDAVDEDKRTWAWTVRAGPVQVRLHHAVAAAPRVGASTRLHLRGPAVVVVPYAPLAHWALRRLVRP